MVSRRRSAVSLYDRVEIASVGYLVIDVVVCWFALCTSNMLVYLKDGSA